MMVAVVRSIEEVEDCFDGSIIKQVVLFHEATEEFVKFLGTLGELDYFPDFPKPFFRLEIDGCCQVKGLLGSGDLKVVLYRNDPPGNLARLTKLLETYPGP